MSALNKRMEKFCQSYLISKNATQSAISAGYSERSAHNQGWRLLKEPQIVERLAELESEYNTDVDVITELEKQYEAAKANGNGATALKALEILSRIRGNNADDDAPQNIEGLEVEGGARAEAGAPGDDGGAAGALDAAGALETSDAVRPIAVLPLAGADGGRPIPVGAFCPARPSDPVREASTFGASALLMWALARRRVRRAEG